jgi:hypothetical protein
MTRTNMYNNKSIYIHSKYSIIKHFFSNKIIFINYIRLKKNIMNPIYNLWRKIDLRITKIKEYHDRRF